MAKYIMVCVHNGTLCSCSKMRDEFTCKDAFSVLSEKEKHLWWGRRGGCICYLNFLPAPPQIAQTVRRACCWLPGINEIIILSTEAFSYSRPY